MPTPRSSYGGTLICEDSLDGAQVTTAEDLAARVSGSLVDAKNLTSRLGGALSIVGLALLGGLVAGAAGSLRAARLRPADALRHID